MPVVGNPLRCDSCGAGSGTVVQREKRHPGQTIGNVTFLVGGLLILALAVYSAVSGNSGGWIMAAAATLWSAFFAYRLARQKFDVVRCDECGTERWVLKPARPA